MILRNKYIEMHGQQNIKSCTNMSVCLSYARPKGRKVFGGVKEQNGELKSTFGQERVATDRKMKKRAQLRASW